MATTIDASALITLENKIGMGEAGKLLGMHPTSVWRHCRIGRNGVKLPYLRVGSKMFTSRPAVDLYLQEVTAKDRAVGLNAKSRPSSQRSVAHLSREHQSADAELTAAHI